MSAAAAPGRRSADLLLHRRRRGPGRRRRVVRGQRRARRWRWSANRAAARASPRCRSCGSFRSRRAGSSAGGSCSRAATCSTLSEPEMRAIRGKEISMIFQEPMTSLNPVYTCGEQIIEALVLHERLDRGRPRSSARSRCWSCVGIPAAAAARRRVSAPDVGRHAAARDDRDGAGVPAGGADRRRADDGARRDDPGADPRAADAAAARAGHGGHPHHARPRRGGRDRRSRGGDVRRPGGRVLRRATAFDRPLHPVHRGAAGVAAEARESGRTALRVIPGNVPNPARFPRGCRFHPRCPVDDREPLPRRSAVARAIEPGPPVALLARWRDRARARWTRSRYPTPMRR